MAIPITETENIERERLIELVEEYRDRGYEILLHPSSEDLPSFLKNYRPDLIAQRDDESIVIEVKSKGSLDSASNQYLHNLAQQIEQNPGWRFKLIMTNPKDATYLDIAGKTLQENEIKSRLQMVQLVAKQDPESALVICWALVEATLRLIVERENLSFQRVDPLYLTKLLATEGIIAKSQYRFLMDSLSLRNAIAHGFKTTEINLNYVYELISIVEELLNDLNFQEEE